jgi:hypothetical protein
MKLQWYMTENDKMVLQNCTDFLKVEPGLGDETCPMSSRDGDQVIDIKVEVSDTQEVEDPLLITLPEIKSEHEVSRMPACPPLSRYHISPVLSFSYSFGCPHLLCWRNAFIGSLRNALKWCILLHIDRTVPVPVCMVEFNTQ